MFLFRDDVDLITEFGYLRKDKKRRFMVYEKFFTEQNEDSLILRKIKNN